MIIPESEMDQWIHFSHRVFQFGARALEESFEATFKFVIHSETKLEPCFSQFQLQKYLNLATLYLMTAGLVK